MDSDGFCNFAVEFFGTEQNGKFLYESRKV